MQKGCYVCEVERKDEWDEYQAHRKVVLAISISESLARKPDFPSQAFDEEFIATVNRGIADLDELPGRDLPKPAPRYGVVQQAHFHRNIDTMFMADGKLVEDVKGVRPIVLHVVFDKFHTSEAFPVERFNSELDQLQNKLRVFEVYFVVLIIITRGVMNPVDVTEIPSPQLFQGKADLVLHLHHDEGNNVTTGNRGPSFCLLEHSKGRPDFKGIFKTAVTDLVTFVQAKLSAQII